VEEAVPGVKGSQLLVSVKTNRIVVEADVGEDVSGRGEPVFRIGTKIEITSVHVHGIYHLKILWWIFDVDPSSIGRTTH